MYLADLHRESPVAQELHLKIADEGYASADLAAQAFGVKALGERWREVDRATAELILKALLEKDMAFQNIRLDGVQVRTAMDEFLSFFEEPARFFTNGNWEDGWRMSKYGYLSFGPNWEPATPATFDGGILALDLERSGILWLEDED